MKPTIRTEVQVTPTINLFGQETYYWRVFQVSDGATINLEGGFGRTLSEALSLSAKSAYEYKG